MSKVAKNVPFREQRPLTPLAPPPLGKDPATKSDKFLYQGGGEAFSIQKFMLQILGTLNRTFLSMKLTQKSNLRVHDMFFQQLY